MNRVKGSRSAEHADKQGQRQPQNTKTTWTPDTTARTQDKEPGHATRHGKEPSTKHQGVPSTRIKVIKAQGWRMSKDAMKGIKGKRSRCGGGDSPGQGELAIDPSLSPIYPYSKLRGTFSREASGFPAFALRKA